MESVDITGSNIMYTMIKNVVYDIEELRAIQKLQTLPSTLKFTPVAQYRVFRGYQIFVVAHYKDCIPSNIGDQ